MESWWANESSLLCEVAGLPQLADVAPQLLLQRGDVGPLLLSGFVIDGVVLQDVGVYKFGV